ncbi:MAG: tagaturonate reductase [Kiritimatiellae bacterium]|nr:tagaturonate reductase [Kiritimatiellia bacterium]
MSETKILQFGEGNFLRCFIDWMVQKANDKAGFDGAVQIIQPIGEELTVPSKILNDRGGKYHTCLRGIIGGKTVEEIEEITCVKGVDVPANVEKYAALPSLRFVVSNTTEAGIQYVKGQDTFPAKVLRLLKVRKAAGLPGLVFIPCELIEHNGDNLKKCVLQHLSDEPDAALQEYIEKECVFCSTLVDRIVAGRPDPESAERYAKQLGEKDEVLVCGEPFHFFVVETPAGFDLEAELPLKKAGINVVYTPDMQPYRTRKVRFLNATHTTLVYLGLEKGFTEVAQCIEDPDFNRFVRKVVFEEIFPTVALPEDEKKEYAESVLERFANPFAHHQLKSIALNTVAKWKTRCLPVVCDYYKANGKLPEAMMQGYEAIARHYDNLKA